MSHFLFAIITGARTGKIEIFPRFLEQEWEEEERDTGVILGSVQTQRLNLLQGFFVGTAPFFVGMTLLVWLASMIKVSSESSSLLTTLFQGYLFFTISNSFFPSWTDIKHVLPLTVIVIIGFVLAWIVGLKVIIQPSPQIIGVADVISSTSFISASVNTAIIILLLVVRKSLGRRH
jgi:hypothetical protein